jgi:hypothetical protein
MFDSYVPLTSLLGNTTMNVNNSTPRPYLGATIGGMPTRPVPIPVSVQRRSVRTHRIKTPYDPENQVLFGSTTANVPHSPILSPPKVVIPKPARSILNVSGVQDMIRDAAICRKCRTKSLLFSVKNIGIASIPSLKCLHCEKNCVVTEPEITSFREASKTGQKRLTDYAANVLFVLGFLSVGDGGTEAQRLLGLLDLPNFTTMETTSFRRMEKEIAPLIVAIAKETLRKNLIEEVECSLDEQKATFDFDEWKEAISNNGCVSHPSKYASVRAGTDMG